MTDYQPLYEALQAAGGAQWGAQVKAEVERILSVPAHGDFARWQAAINRLPLLFPDAVDLLDEVRIGSAEQIDPAQRSQLIDALQQLHPWRKGPYSLYGVHVDTEWRSDWKWERIRQRISPLANRMVLDVGCGNGYHCWRMLGAGARLVMGIDPTLLSVMQFEAVNRLYGSKAPLYVLPLGIEQVPPDSHLFDTVFSMGVLYHRRSPIDHLLELQGCLRPGGELVLETLVVDGDENTVMLPRKRYSQMRNVWFLPSCAALEKWLYRCGFRDIELCDVTRTTEGEQRSTEWMRFNSLRDFLDTENRNLTIEGLPAPVRAVFTATFQ